MTIGIYTFSIETAVIAAVAALWLLCVLIAIVTPAARKNYSLRRVDVLVLVLSLGLGTTWFFTMVHKGRPTPVRSAPVKSCLLIEPGQSEEKVRGSLGEPDEIRSAAELRGPGSDLWIYRDQRCVVHYLDGNVISVE
jgi:hypothetical protein